MTETIIVANARLELLRLLAWNEETFHGPDQEQPNYYPTHIGLYGCGVDWQNDTDDIRLAARESAKLGHIDLHERDVEPYGAMMRITPAGHAWIRAHDLMGEIAQESPTPGAEHA